MQFGAQRHLVVGEDEPEFVARDDVVHPVGERHHADQHVKAAGGQHLGRPGRRSHTRCHACSRCCHNKAIRVGPYEILRLARRLGMTTTEFIAQHTEAGGTMLRMREENNRACIFLSEKGCGVHPDRPLACRLYPLARWVDPDGQESFGHLVPHPKTEDVYGTGATIGDYLDQQGAAPFFDVGDRYGAVYQRMVERLEDLDADELQHRSSRRNDVDLFYYCRTNEWSVRCCCRQQTVANLSAISPWSCHWRRNDLLVYGSDNTSGFNRRL